MNNDYEKLEDFLIYAICFVLGAITFFIFPKDYATPVGPPTTPTRTIVEQTTVNGMTCTIYNSNTDINPTPICRKAQ